MEINLVGQTALVTGASKGIGKGIALELARHGCDVAVNYNVDAAGAQATVEEIRAMGRKAVAVQANVGDTAQVEAMFEALWREFPQLDILVNNAGIQTWAPLLELKESDWDRVLATNLKGCFLCTQRAARHMKERRRGRIITLGSGCNKVAFPRLVDYTASKGGIEQFTKVAAVELGPFGITVNCVAPGAIEIERTQQETTGASYAETWAPLTPLGRIGTPRDVARVVLFLVSELADFVTGQTIWVDGGLFAKPHWPYE